MASESGFRKWPYKWTQKVDSDSVIGMWIQKVALSSGLRKFNQKVGLERGFKKWPYKWPQKVDSESVLSKWTKKVDPERIIYAHNGIPKLLIFEK